MSLLSHFTRPEKLMLLYLRSSRYGPHFHPVPCSLLWGGISLCMTQQPIERQGLAEATQHVPGAGACKAGRSGDVLCCWLLSVARGKRPSGTPGASDTVSCGPSPCEDKQAMPSLKIIKTRFWPVIHYNITARAALWS